MRLIISFPSLVPLFLFLFFSSSSPLTLIQETCEKCSETDPNIRYDFCTASFESSPDGPLISDLRHLGLLAIRLTKRNVTSTRRFVKNMSSGKRGKSLDPYVRACLSDCLVLYSDAISTVKDAAKDYKKRRYGDANIALSAVLTRRRRARTGSVRGRMSSRR